MVKKNAILFLIIFLFLLLAGCEQPEKFELTDGMIRENYASFDSTYVLIDRTAE
ncbi:MAG: hypothetical protein WBK54_01670 [Bacilli bacterium]|jgi:major membrane immunogen (membrane-anchored lipoprotein)|nr:hypothetical protein [Acholeplasmataceae bacterium]